MMIRFDGFEFVYVMWYTVPSAPSFPLFFLKDQKVGFLKSKKHRQQIVYVHPALQWLKGSHNCSVKTS